MAWIPNREIYVKNVVILFTFWGLLSARFVLADDVGSPSMRIPCVCCVLARPSKHTAHMLEVNAHTHTNAYSHTYICVCIQILWMRSYVIEMEKDGGTSTYIHIQHSKYRKQTAQKALLVLRGSFAIYIIKPRLFLFFPFGILEMPNWASLFSCAFLRIPFVNNAQKKNGANICTHTHKHKQQPFLKRTHTKHSRTHTRTQSQWGFPSLLQTTEEITRKVYGDCTYRLLLFNEGMFSRNNDNCTDTETRRAGLCLVGLV